MRVTRVSLTASQLPFKVSSNISLLAPRYPKRGSRSAPINTHVETPAEKLEQKISPRAKPKPIPKAIVPSKAAPSGETNVLAKRWVRDPFETCVLKAPRVSDILPHYVAYYKFADYTWRPILLLPAGDPVALETRARHVAYELRHLSEFGHAVWVTTKTAHSVYYPRGVIERSYVECTYFKGNRQRLQCYIRHEGLIDGGDAGSERGLIAVSMVHTLSGPEDRWEMLICRSRRNGAMSAGLSALNLKLISPALVGKRQIEEVFLLEPHTEVVGSGLSARCIASCWNVCKHPHLYVNPMEVPVAVGLDSIMQGIHYTALTANKLVQRGERMACLAFSVESFHPFPPIEAELPYGISLSSPVVFAPGDATWEDSQAIGRPFVEGGPVQRYAAAITVGFAQFCDHRTMTPLEKAHKWWAHHDETPYRVVMYTTRESHLRSFYSTDMVTDNPFDAKNPYATPNSKTIERERLRNAMWRRIEEMGADPEADIDGDGIRSIGEEREDIQPYLLTAAQDKAPEDVKNRKDLLQQKRIQRSDGVTTIADVQKRLKAGKARPKKKRS